MKKLTQKEQEMLWGDGGPYSEAKIVLETRILDNSVSRETIEVRGNINPTTFKLIKKHLKEFENDEIVLQLISNARYSGKGYGYEISGGAFEYNDKHREDIMKTVQKQLEYTREAIIRMHKFVIKYFDL